MSVAFTPQITDRPVHAIGDLQMLVGDLAFTSTYATGGNSLDLAALFSILGAGTVLYVGVQGVGYDFEYDITNKKLKVFTTANTELSAGAYPADLTGASVKLLAIGL